MEKTNKYYFAIDGIVKEVKFFKTDAEAFDYRCKLERIDNQNWKVYNEYGDLVYGVYIGR